MASYFFETISAAQALAFNAAVDTLQFNSGSSTSLTATVAGGTATLSLNGRTVVFGPGFMGRVGVFPDGSTLSVGGTGPDLFAPLFGRDALFGGDGDDILRPGDDADQAHGGAGDDVVEGSEGDTLSGGAGIDTLSYALNGPAVVNLATGMGTDRVSSFENVQGSPLADRITGDAQSNILRGGAMGDMLDGGAGADTLEGEDGSDDLIGGDGADLLIGGRSSDQLRGGAGADIFRITASDGTSDQIGDWSSEDRLQFDTPIGGYLEVGSGTVDVAGLFASGIRYIALQSGSSVAIFVDTAADGGSAEDQVILIGRTLADVSEANFIGVDAPAPGAPPVAPAVPTPPVAPITGFGDGEVGTAVGNMDTAVIGNLILLPTVATTIQASFAGPGVSLVLGGSGFTFAGAAAGPAAGQLAGGSVRTVVFRFNETFVLNLTGSLSATPFTAWIAGNRTTDALSGILAESDVLDGGPGADVIRGFDGSDHLRGFGGGDALFGGAGDDVIHALAPSGLTGSVGNGAAQLRGEAGNDFLIGGAQGDDLDGGVDNDTVRGGDGNDLILGDTGDDRLFGETGLDSLMGGAGADTLDGGAGIGFLRGGEGNDLLVGSDLFDDSHGNQGDDTVSGGASDDWVVGGQGNDLLFGGDGGDLCYGQLGSDTIDAGAGDDAVVGGQANDLLSGGAGADFITGDRGSDTLTGGSGADTFFTSNVTGTDRVTDFSAAEGDRVQVAVGVTYTLRQDAADTVVDMGGGAVLVLTGVQLSSLPNGWIFS